MTSSRVAPDAHIDDLKRIHRFRLTIAHRSKFCTLPVPRSMNADYLRTLVDYHYWARDRALDAVATLSSQLQRISTPPKR